MSKFTYNDIVCVKPTATVWLDVHGSRRPGPRVGERAWVYGIDEEQNRPPFRPGTIYGIEFEGGDSIEIHEDDLDLVEAAEIPPKV